MQVGRDVTVTEVRGGTRLMLTHSGPGSERGAVIEVPDLEATLASIGSLGGKTVTPVTEIPGAVTFAEFSDPEGNVVGIAKSDD